MTGSITSVPGVRVGHATNAEARTGVTVIDFPEPNVAAVEVRGAAPGSRETELLRPGMRVETIQSLVFAGGSSFGLAAADGVVAELAAAGRGHDTPGGRVPIVPAAIIYDLLVGDGSVRPTAEDGRAAFRAASTDPVATGPVGAGTGATVAGWRSAPRPGGVGSAALRVGDATIGALVVLNAVGDVFTLEGEPITGGPPVPTDHDGPWSAAPLQATTLVAIATDATAARTDLLRLAVRAHDALGATLRPAHTRYDGDAVFVVSCGTVAADLDALGEAAFTVTGRAIESVFANEVA